MKIKLLLIAFTLALLSCTKDTIQEVEKVIDIDGNIYETVKIGEQIWMTQNLKTTTFNDGEPIKSSPWASNEGRYQWASTNDLNNAVDFDIPSDYYGVIYNFAAINSGKLAPKGWRVATLEDWKQLISNVKENGYANRDAFALKSDSGWFNNGHGDNVFGFNALPAGYVDTFGTPKVDGIIANWGTKNQLNQFTYETVSLLYDTDKTFIGSSTLSFGTSVRCIKE